MTNTFWGSQHQPHSEGLQNKYKHYEYGVKQFEPVELLYMHTYIIKMTTII